MKHETQKELKKAYEKDYKRRIGKVVFLATLTIDHMKIQINSLKTELAIRTKERDDLTKQIASCENALHFKERYSDSLQIERDAWRKTAELAQKETRSIAKSRGIWKSIAIGLLVYQVSLLVIHIVMSCTAK